jgi:hydrogenase maturation protease
VTPRVLVAGIGNVFLGDDGFGSELARLLLGRQLPAGVRVVDYGIRGMHLAYDLLEGYEVLVLVDAVPGSDVPGTVRVLEIGERDLGPAGVDAHAMDPATVLASLRALGGRLPRTFVVGCVPADVSEGIGLSGPVLAALDTAAQVVADLVGRLLTRVAPAVQARVGG